MNRTTLERQLMPSTYVSYLARVFADQVRLTAGTTLPSDGLVDYAGPVTVAETLSCAANAIAMAQSPTWHLDLAKGMAEHYHGPVTVALLSAPTLGDGLDAFIKFMPSRVPYFRWRGYQEGDDFYCELIERLELGVVRFAAIEIPILITHEYVKTIRGGSTDGARIELRYSPTPYRHLYSNWFDCPVVFDSPRNAFIIPKDWLSLKNVGYDESSWLWSLRRCEQNLDQDGDIVGWVQREIVALLEASSKPVSVPNLEALATRLHISPRTLIRRLRRAGTCYQDIVDEIQKGRARELLADKSLRIYQVAEQLGYEDPASFGRSFKRWFGMTPGAYRSTLTPKR